MVGLLSTVKLAELVESWKQWDRNDENKISRIAFVATEITSRVKGLETTGFADWDLNRDGNVSRDEVARVLIDSMTTQAPPKDRATEAEKARERSYSRFPRTQP